MTSVEVDDDDGEWNVSLENTAERTRGGGNGKTENETRIRRS
jgi:hypothetical protein